MTPNARVVLLLFVQTVLAGCSVLNGRPDAIEAELDSKPIGTPVPVRPTAPEDKPITVKQSETTSNDSKLQPGTGRLINYEAAAAPQAGGTRGGEGEVTFNFENQPIQAVVQSILGALLNENYSISPNVTGNVTFSTSKPITAEQALPVLEMLLSWTNNALIRKQGRYEVVPVKDAVAGNLSLTTGSRLTPGYQVRVFPLKYISPTEMQKLLKPYAKADSILSADDARSMIVLAGSAFELQNYERTINIFDVDWLKGMSVGVFGLRNADVTKIMPELDKLFGEKAETPLGGMFRFIPLETTNSVIVITPQPEYLKRIQEWFYRLDAGVGENGTQLYVYDVKNVKAVDLSDHLNAIFTGQSSGTSKSTSGSTAPGLRSTNIGGLGGATSGGINASNYSTGLNQNRTQQQQQTTKPNTNLTTTGTGKPTGAAGAGTKESDIRITAIEENNQLLIMATPGEYDSILAAIHRLDVSPLQVQIEAKVLEVTLTGDLEFGVQWWLAGLINSNNSGTGYQYGSGFQGNAADRHRASLGGSSPPGVNGGNGLFYSFLNKNFQVALNTLQTSGNSKILSAPSMVVLNNQEAQITVGTQIPIVQTSIVGYPTTTTGTTTGDISNTGIGQVSYISTGVTLDVKPRVNPGGLVYMDVSQEVSAPGTPAAGSTNPPISQRQLQTQIAVQSGQTVLLGGLISENDISSDSGVPGLSSIPLLGKLFGNTSKNRSRTEIIVLITPQVITNAEDARAMTDEYQKRLEALAPLRANQKTSAAQPNYVPPPPASSKPDSTQPAHQ